MNVYVVDYSGEDEAREVLTLLRKHDPNKRKISNIFPSVGTRTEYEFPALFFVHVAESDRVALENLLLDASNEKMPWALVHYFRSESTHPARKHPKVCQHVLRIEDLYRMEADWLMRLQSTTMEGVPDFSGIKETLPVATVAAYLMQKAGLDFGLVEGLTALAHSECPSGQYEKALESYFLRQTGHR